MERSIRSVMKAVSWRFLATATTFSIVYLLTGQLVLALEVGGLEASAKLVLYYLHERVWTRQGWGVGGDDGGPSQHGMPDGLD